MYNENDILTYEDLNNIENRIKSCTADIIELTNFSIPVYEINIWEKKSFLLANWIKHIEDGIYNLGKYYFRPFGWIVTKNWDVSENQSFSYKDVNRWLNNLSLIEERLNKESNLLLPRDALYPNNNLLPR